MSDQLMKRVVLTAEKIGNKESMAAFMKAALDLPEYFGGNLDALADLLSEIREDTVGVMRIDTNSQKLEIVLGLYLGQMSDNKLIVVLKVH